MKYKLLATDLDGTLLNKTSLLSAVNIAAVKKARAKGLNVIIASGRSHESIKNFNAELGITDKNAYGISFNGAVVYKADTMEILFEKRLDASACDKIYRAVKAYDKDAPLILYTPAGDTVYYERSDPSIERYYTRSKLSSEMVSDLRPLYENGVAKLLIRHDPVLLRELYEAVKGELEGVCEMVFSAPHFLELGVLGNSKASGLEFLGDYLGFGLSDMAAAGDNYNDIEMIEAAGLGIAVANAVDELKAVADFVTEADNDHDAVAEIIGRILKQH